MQTRLIIIRVFARICKEGSLSSSFDEKYFIPTIRNITPSTANIRLTNITLPPFFNS